MTRWQDLKLRLFTLMVPVLIPIVIILIFVQKVCTAIEKLLLALWDELLLNIKEIGDWNMISNYFKALRNVFFDWEIGACLKPRSEEYKRKKAEMEKRDFGDKKQ